MDIVFFTKLLLSLIIGGSWVVLATVSGDKHGSKIGGLVSGLPSTVMFTLFFLAWSQTPSIAVAATTIIPIVGGVNCLFLLCYMYFVKKGFWSALILSLAIWAIFSYYLMRIHFNNYPLSLFTFASLYTISFLMVESILKIKSTRGKPVKYTSKLVVGRALLGGFIVAFAVYMGKIGGPIFGGMFSMFPAMFISTMLVTYFTHGALFSSGTMKSSLVSGFSIVAYSVVARYTYLPLGIWVGTLLSILVSFGVGIVIYKTVVTKLN